VLGVVGSLFQLLEIVLGEDLSKLESNKELHRNKSAILEQLGGSNESNQRCLEQLLLPKHLDRVKQERLSESANESSTQRVRRQIRAFVERRGAS